MLTGPLEETNEPYAIAKIAGLSMCKSFHRQYGFKYIAVMPTNLYGPNDNFDLETSHVLPALIRKFHEAKLSNSPAVVIWGTGTPRREFLYVDDLAEACIFLMQNYDDIGLVNVGMGVDLTIQELAELISKVVGYTGVVEYDQSKPDGTPQKLCDVTKVNKLGWSAKVSLEEGIRKTYNWYVHSLT